MNAVRRNAPARDELSAWIFATIEERVEGDSLRDRSMHLCYAFAYAVREALTDAGQSPTLVDYTRPGSGPSHVAVALDDVRLDVHGAWLASDPPKGLEGLEEKPVSSERETRDWGCPDYDDPKLRGDLLRSLRRNLAGRRITQAR